VPKYYVKKEHRYVKLHAFYTTIINGKNWYASETGRLIAGKSLHVTIFRRLG